MNYVLEGKENFNDRLLTALCNTETNDTKQKCLISNNNLENNAITLNCKHTFNYSPLIKEITKQKSVANRLEIQRLKKFQIKCPYCRQIHNHILPYRALDKQIFGVNWPPKYALQPHRCQAILKSGKRKGVACEHPCFEKFCNKHKPRTISAISAHEYCTAILKNGKNKGKQCSYKSKKGGRCGIHKL